MPCPGSTLYVPSACIHTSPFRSPHLTRLLFAYCRFVAPLQAAHIAFQPHLFVDDEQAPPESIAAAVDGVAKEVDGTMIIVARSNKVRPCLDPETPESAQLSHVTLRCTPGAFPVHLDNHNAP